MMAVVDARYRFSYISVGAQGRASDAGVFAESDFKQALDSVSSTFLQQLCGVFHKAGFIT